MQRHARRTHRTGRQQTTRALLPFDAIFLPLSPESVLGGFRAQGRTAVKARQVVEDALAVQEAGAFAVVVECVPSPVAKAVTEALEIPTIGIGAGPFNSGQVSGLKFGRGWLQGSSPYLRTDGSPSSGETIFFTRLKEG